MTEVPPPGPGSNHSYSGWLKPEDPDDFFTDKPVPIFNFGDLLRHKERPLRGEVIGLMWRNNTTWFYCLDYAVFGYGWWVAEDKLERIDDRPTT